MKTFIGWLLFAVVLVVVFNMSYPSMMQTRNTNTHKADWDLIVVAECKEELNIPDTIGYIPTQQEMQNLSDCVIRNRPKNLEGIQNVSPSTN